MGIGIDIASVDGNTLNVPGMKAQAGVSFGIIRAAYGTYVDKTFAKYRQAFKDAGLPYGAYIMPQYPRPANAPPEPEVQADSVAKTVGELADSEFPIFVDVEFSTDVQKESGLSAAQMVAWIDRMLARLRQIYGCPAGIYTSARVMYEPMKNIPTPQWADNPHWVKGIGGVKSMSPYLVDVRKAAILKPNIKPPNLPPSFGDQWMLQQYQGDSLGCPGTTTTTDLNKWNILRLGASNGTVAWIQRRLAGLLVAVDPFRARADTGVWDDTTDKAFGDWQASVGLSADRIFGPQSFARLAKAPLAAEKQCG